MAIGVTIIPKLGVIMPEDIYNKKMMEGGIHNNGIENLTQEEASKMAGTDSIQKEGGSIVIPEEHRQIINVSPEVAIQEQQITQPYISENGAIDWSKR